MYQRFRFARSASDWTCGQLFAYNISIIPTSPAEFFQSSADPTLNHLDPAILTSPLRAAQDPNLNLSEVAEEYLGYLDLTSPAIQENAIVDFGKATLELLGYNERHTTLATRYDIPLTICGEIRESQADLCLIHRPTSAILLILFNDKSRRNEYGVDGEAQLVGQSIAAFQYNNERRGERGLPILESMTIPCISMCGTVPTFYLVPVTRELSEAVMMAQYPISETRVLNCVTAAAHRIQFSDGMADIEFRHIALKRFIAFKGLAKSCWEQLLA